MPLLATASITTTTSGSVQGFVFNNEFCSDNGVKEHYGSNYATDYYTDKLKNDSDAFLASWDQKDPFMMMIGFVPACMHVMAYTIQNAMSTCAKHLCPAICKQLLGSQSSSHT